MLDDSDVDFCCGAGIGASGIAAIVFLVIALIVWGVVQGNKEECGERSCPVGMTAKLLDHTCLCVGPEAKIQ